MRILITGNMGYIGPSVVRRLRRSYPGATLIGLDMGYFAHCLTASAILPECQVDLQYFCDVRSVSPEIIRGVDVVVYLAAISNDPMGAVFEAVTHHINHYAAVRLAVEAKEAGAKGFVFASSCSVYGCAEEGPRTERSPVNPLTAYSRSKVSAEHDLAELGDGRFTVTCLRFATACGMSDRLRLDLVLNDFVANAVATGRIEVLSDGTPWRPLIHIDDMARAIDWAVQREPNAGGASLTVNAGSDGWNYQVKELADAVSKAIPGVETSVNRSAPSDKRSYRVSFQKFTTLADGFLPERDLLTVITELRDGLEAMGFRDARFRSSSYMRLNALRELKAAGHLTDTLEWATPRPSRTASALKPAGVQWAAPVEA
ncbi:NAD-dependent epimerase/dehydratase family protein [Candidatus Nitrospira bockiana]